VYVRPAAPPPNPSTGGVDRTRGLSSTRLPKGGRGPNSG
jgi:hypothetical protein